MKLCTRCFFDDEHLTNEEIDGLEKAMDDKIDWRVYLYSDVRKELVAVKM